MPREPLAAAPELDRLHDDCVRLTDFHVDPMCAPTHAGLMTGRYSARTGVWSTLTGRYMMARDEVIIGDAFASAGYATGMFGKWHLGDTWLFNIGSDPGQTLDLADEHGEVVGRVLGEYERRWNSVSERFGDDCPTFIGGEEEPVKITAHSWRGGPGLYNQWHVRPGLVDNGRWPIQVVQPGHHKFRLCRWPEESNAAIRAPLPPRRGVPFVDDLVPGAALDIVSARLKVDAFDGTVSVGEADHAATFRVSLPAGCTELETFFTDTNGVVPGAYYVYVRRLGDVSRPTGDVL